MDAQLYGHLASVRHHAAGGWVREQAPSLMHYYVLIHGRYFQRGDDAAAPSAATASPRGAGVRRRPNIFDELARATDAHALRLHQQGQDIGRRIGSPREKVPQRPGLAPATPMPSAPAARQTGNTAARRGSNAASEVAGGPNGAAHSIGSEASSPAPKTTLHGRVLTGMDAVNVPTRRHPFEAGSPGVHGEMSLSEAAEIAAATNGDDSSAPQSPTARSSSAFIAGFGDDSNARRAAALAVRQQHDTVLLDVAAVTGIFALAVVLARSLAT